LSRAVRRKNAKDVPQGLKSLRENSERRHQDDQSVA
jgi:hypothetical protein